MGCDGEDLRNTIKYLVPLGLSPQLHSAMGCSQKDLQPMATSSHSEGLVQMQSFVQ